MNKFLIIFFLILLSCKSVKVECDLEPINTKVKYHENGMIKSVGNVEDFTASQWSYRLGLWSEFYDNGNLKESGHYKFDFYLQCCSSGPCSGAYSYKIGEWVYYYKNGNLKAKGIYLIGKKHIETSCEEGDNINFGFVTEDWVFYNENGVEVKPTKDKISEIESTSYLDGFDMHE